MALTEQEQQLCRRIAERAEPLMTDLRLHVGIPTGKAHVPGLDETRERFTARCEAIGASVRTIEGDTKPDWLDPEPSSPPPTAVCERTAGRGGTRVLIAGHLDTVHDPAGDFRSLTVRPDGKTALGPGCVDMKGGLVIAMAAIEALEEIGADVAWTYLMNSDEETGTFHSERALRDEATRHDVGLALEPALPDGSLAVDRLGSGQFMIETTGRAAHVGRAFTEGVSAVTALGHALVRVAEMPAPERGRILNVGPLEGNAAPNAVPDRARAWGNCRFPTREVAQEIDGMLADLETPSDAMPGVRVHRVFNRPAKPLVPATERVALLARSAAEAMGQSLPFSKTGGVCDGNILQDAGLPTIDTLGVRGGGLHTPDEWIELASLVERCQLLALTILRLSRTDPADIGTIEPNGKEGDA
ncbi:MAG: M20/M25/M40 family metallo-hydrolase [Planctomycetota bacterium]